jgi:hypothetical protein
MNVFILTHPEYQLSGMSKYKRKENYMRIDEQKSDIPPKSEWRNLSIGQLYDLRTKLTNKYYDLLRINASFADQFQRFGRECDALIAYQEAVQRQQQEEQ